MEVVMFIKRLYSCAVLLFATASINQQFAGEPSGSPVAKLESSESIELSVAERQMVKQLYVDPINDESLAHLFPMTVDEVGVRVTALKKSIMEDVQHVVDLPVEQRTFENTAQAFDLLNEKMVRLSDSLNALFSMVSDKKLSDAAQKGMQELQSFSQKWIVRNSDLYRAFKSYVESNASKEKLDDEQRFYVQKTIRTFERNGLNLPSEQLDYARKLESELTELVLQFEKNIKNDTAAVVCTAEELDGAPAAIIKPMQQADGSYLVPMKKYFSVARFIKSQDVRKKLFLAYSDIAYPANVAVLKQIIAKRDELAKLLGFSSYAEYDLDNTMAKSISVVQGFLDALVVRSQKKADLESKALRDLPQTPENSREKLQSWDIGYLRDQLLKRPTAKDAVKIDGETVKHYFPRDYVLDQVIKIVSNFFSLRFEPFVATGLWDKDVTCFKVYDNIGQFRAYLFLDLPFRDTKQSAEMLDIVRPVKTNAGSIVPAVISISTNTELLLKFDEVRQLLHEFGHAMHCLFGATRMYAFSGVRVPDDFAEVPSQMLQAWRYDAHVLKKLSHHDVTGEPIPDDMIARLIEERNANIGGSVLFHSVYSLYGLGIYQGVDKDVIDYYHKVRREVRSDAQTDDADHSPVSIRHFVMPELGDKYYSYLWSEMISIDLFTAIRDRSPEGLTDPKVGKELVDKVLSKGGSVDPNILLADFLGRPTNQEAYLRYYGLA
jgi:thimet oligopeptidase